MKKILPTLLAAAFAAAPLAAAVTDEATSTAPYSSDGNLGATPPIGASVQGQVLSVDGNTLQIRESDGSLHNVSVSGNAAIFDDKMKPVSLRNVRKGQTITLQNGSVTPAGSLE